MKTILDFLNGRCRFASELFSADITRQAAILGMIVSPTLWAIGIILETSNLAGLAYIIYLIAAILFIPILAEFSTTNKD